MNKYEIMYNIKCQLEEINLALQYMQLMLERPKNKNDMYNTAHTEQAIKHLNNVRYSLQSQLKNLEQSTETTLTK
jgi:hypothetical protein